MRQVCLKIFERSIRGRCEITSTKVEKGKLIVNEHPNRFLYIAVAVVVPLIGGCASDAIRANNQALYVPTVSNLPTANVRIDGRNGESLRRSLAEATRPLNLNQRESFIADFMGSNRVSWCLESGKIYEGEYFNKARTKQQCVQQIQKAAAIAKPYLNDERMDGDYARRVTTLASGPIDLGRTRAESFAVYVDQHQKYFHGLTVAQIQQNAEFYKRQASDPSLNASDSVNRTLQNLPFAGLFLSDL